MNQLLRRIVASAALLFVTAGALAPLASFAQDASKAPAAPVAVPVAPAAPVAPTGQVTRESVENP